MSDHNTKISGVETIYCLTVAGTGLALIAAAISLKVEPRMIYVVCFLGAILLAMFPAGIVMEIAHRRMPVSFTVIMCIGLTGFMWFVFSIAKIRFPP